MGGCCITISSVFERAATSAMTKLAARLFPLCGDFSWGRRAAFLSSLRPSHSHTPNNRHHKGRCAPQTQHVKLPTADYRVCVLPSCMIKKKTKPTKNKTPCFCSSVTFLPYPNITSSESMNTTYAPYSHTVSEKYNWVQRFG